MTTIKPSHMILSRRLRESARSRASGLFCLCALLSLAAGCQSQRVGTLDAARTEHPVYTLAPGDELRVTVFEHDNISGTFTVDDAGTISLPLVRRISVEDMTLPQVEQAVTEELRANLIADPRVSVNVAELRPLCVLGEVRSPGCFPYVHGMTASEAIAIAGGYTYRARRDEFVVTSDDGTRMMGANDTPVFSGDVIQIRERRF